MIARLTGKILEVGDDRIVLDVNGVGYAVFAPASTLRKAGAAGSVLTLHTHMNVREDAIQLYGFASADEKGLFESVIAVSGIGPKLGLAVLSGLTPAEFRRAVLDNNVTALTAITGVGRKTAQRLIMELRDRMTGGTDPGPESGRGDTSAFQDAVTALVTLGYPRPTAVKAVRGAVDAAGDAASVEDLIRKALGDISVR